MISIWIRDVVFGIQYLHSKGFAHCAIAAENVLLNEDNRSQLCHFHDLIPIKNRVKSSGIKSKFWPPEMFEDRLPGIHVANGEEFDIWLLGVFVLEMLSGNYLKIKLKDKIILWTEQVYPKMFKVLQPEKLEKLCKSAYPKAEMEHLRSKRNFVTICLRLNPNVRARLDELVAHSFVGGTGDLACPEDEIWIKTVKWKKLKNRVEKVTYFHETKTDLEVIDRQYETEENHEVNESQMSYVEVIEKVACSDETDKELDVTGTEYGAEKYRKVNENQTLCGEFVEKVAYTDETNKDLEVIGTQYGVEKYREVNGNQTLCGELIEKIAYNDETNKNLEG